MVEVETVEEGEGEVGWDPGNRGEEEEERGEGFFFRPFGANVLGLLIPKVTVSDAIPATGPFYCLVNVYHASYMQGGVQCLRAGSGGEGGGGRREKMQGR